jgi:protein translocase SecG subunit
MWNDHNFTYSMSLGLFVLFVSQILACLTLVIVVLLQSSDEDALSNISSGSGKFGMAAKKSSVDSITKFTIALGAFLMINSAVLTAISTRRYSKKKSLVKDYLEQKDPGAGKTPLGETPSERKVPEADNPATPTN